MSDLKCPICGSENNEIFIRSKDYFILNGNSDDFSVYFCKDCENGFSFPFMNNEELSKYYPDDYDCYKSHKSLTGYIQKLKAGNDIRIIRRILKNRENDILEIGAGSGLFLHLLKRRFFRVSDIEMSASGVKYAKENFDLDLEKCFFEDYNTERKFDMILAFHVLEHFNDPVTAINKMKSLLKENGYLYLKIPRLDSWPAKIISKYWTGFDLPRHRTHFTKNGLVKLLSSQGFKIEFFKPDYGPLDIIRAVKYNSEFSQNVLKKLTFRIFNSLPFLLKLPAAVFLEIILSPFKPGRMSVIVRKAE
jgi:SAM-dependent methyltransferase